MERRERAHPRPSAHPPPSTVRDLWLHRSRQAGGAHRRQQALNAFNNGAGARSLPDTSGASRRTFLRMAGTAGALGLAGAAIRARPARAAVATHNFLGSYEGVRGVPNQWFNQIHAVVPGLSGFRQYDNKPVGTFPQLHNNLATTWPAPPYPRYVGPSVFSIYPLPESLGIGGPVDPFTEAQINYLIASAPPDSYLSAWHEFGSIDYSGFGVNAGNLRALHGVLNLACKGSNVTYGPILFAPATQDYDRLVSAFDSCPPDMGFYGVDVYGNRGTCAGLQQLENFINLAKPLDAITPNYPKLLIAETNTPLTPPPCTPEPSCQVPPAPRSGGIGVGWYETICARMHNYGANSIGVLTYWNENGQLSGPWDPGPTTSTDPDGTTVTALTNCIDKIFTAKGTLGWSR